MGVNLGRVKNISIATINELFMLTQPAHLQLNKGTELDPDSRDAVRAEIIRSKLCQN
jgi:protein arginine kinase